MIAMVDDSSDVCDPRRLSEVTKKSETLAVVLCGPLLGGMWAGPSGPPFAMLQVVEALCVSVWAQVDCGVGSVQDAA